MPEISLREAHARGLTDPRTVSISHLMFEGRDATCPEPTPPTWAEGPDETAVWSPGTVVAKRRRKAGTVYVLVAPEKSMLNFRPWQAERANKLGREEITAVVLCVAVKPFPLGTGAETYARALAAVREGRLAEYGAEMPKEADDLPLWRLRAAIAEKASRGVNAPWDTYLRIAVGEEE